MIKYPKTPRIKEADVLGWERLNVVVSEKLDGANAGISFTKEGMDLQSRGHILLGGYREAQFDLFKAQCWAVQDQLRAILGTRYLVFGEWCYAKHRLFYDALPSYFMTYDVFDKEEELFLSTPRRQALLKEFPFPEAPILHQGVFRKVSNFAQFIGTSQFRTQHWKERMLEIAQFLNIRDPLSHTDDSRLMEGVYVKVEDGHQVIGRIKLPRGEFEKVRDSDLWKRHQVLPNRLAV